MEGTKRPVTLFQRCREVLRTRRYALRTEKTYLYWIRFYVRFNRGRHPRELGEAHVSRFLTWLAVKRNVSSSTQDLALNALVFLYRHVLEQPLGDIRNVTRSTRPRRVPVVLTEDEVRLVLGGLQGQPRLVASLLYGSGLRLMEALRLRVKDLEFERRALVVRAGKGNKDRVVTLPDNLVVPLEEHLARVRSTHKTDLAEGYGRVWLPDALARKYPSAPAEWGWQYVFPSSRRSVDPYSGVIRRHHFDHTAVQKAVRVAVS